MHISLQNKYRPSTFPEVVGQEHITDILSKLCLKPDNLATGTIFTAVPGSGKTTLARILAKAINCSHETVKPCNECQDCNLFNNLKADGLPGHPDYYEVDATTYGSKEDIEKLLELAQLTPVQGKKRIILIDEVHSLSSKAFDVLLKPLEEGLKHTYFLMATTDQDKIRKAIISRCPLYAVRPLSQKKLYSYLKFIITEEGVEYNEKALTLLSYNYTGKTRDAVTHLDSILSAKGNLLEYSENSIYENILEAIVFAYTGDLEAANELVKETIAYKSLDLSIDTAETVLAIYTKDINLLKEKTLSNFTEVIGSDLKKILNLFLSYDIKNSEKLILVLCIISELDRKKAAPKVKATRTLKSGNSGDEKKSALKKLSSTGKFS